MTGVAELDAAAAQPAVSSPRRKMANALAWTAAGKWLSQLFAWASTLIVVRLLSPADFGLLGMAATYLGLVGLISEFGIGTAIVTLRDLTGKQISQLHTASVTLGVIGTIASACLAVPLSRFFHAPQLAALVVVMGFNFVIASFRSVPYALLQKDHRFDTLSWMDAVQALVQAISSAVLVWMGLRFWAIAISGLLGTIVASVLPYSRRPAEWAKPQFASIWESILFSWQILVSRLAWYLYSNADFIVAGRYLGQVALGSYTMAWNFANLPGEKIVALVTSVTPTFFATVRHDKEAVRGYFSTLTEVLAVVMFPVVTGFALLAPDLVPLACGPQWRSAVVPMQLLAIYTFLRSVVALLPQILIAIGEARFAMWNSLLMLGLLPGAFWFASRWGILGIAGAWVAVYPVLTVPLYKRTFRAIDMSLKQYLAALAPSLIGTAVMAIAVEAIRLTTPLHAATITRITLEAAAGFLVYPATLFLFFRQRAINYCRLVKRIKSA